MTDLSRSERLVCFIQSSTLGFFVENLVAFLALVGLHRTQSVDALIPLGLVSLFSLGVALDYFRDSRADVEGHAASDRHRVRSLTIRSNVTACKALMLAFAGLAAWFIIRYPETLPYLAIPILLGLCYRSVKPFTGMKTAFMAALRLHLLVLVPWWALGVEYTLTGAAAFLLLAFAKEVFWDLDDSEADRLAGVHTLSTLLGLRGAQLVVVGCLLVSLILTCAETTLASWVFRLIVLYQALAVVVGYNRYYLPYLGLLGVGGLAIMTAA